MESYFVELCTSVGCSTNEEMGDELVEEELNILYDDLYAVMSLRRGIEYFVPKSKVWTDDILSQFDDNRFRQMMRCSKGEFHHLASLISTSAEFHHKNSGKQFSIDLQLAIVLYRLGASGESASIRKIATLFGIGDGGTIQNITVRVFRAFLELQKSFIFWPDKEERMQIVKQTFSELPYCIGYVDGTEFKLAETPIDTPLDYFSRKHIYSIKAQITCDHKLRIRHVSVGAPGSVHDARIFSSCNLALNSSNYFSENQWIAADSAYSLSNTVITPYRTNSSAMTCSKRKQFNLRHSRYRVRAEHCIGMLKERFGSLKELRHRIANEKNKRLCSLWIIVTCIIHNILICDNDNSFSSNDIVSSCDFDEEESDTSIEEVDQTQFDIKRQAIHQIMFT